MAAAFALWTAVTAFALPQSIQLAFASLLVALVLITLRTMRRGQCPRCGKRIRFAPRIEIPPACVHCNIDFRSAAVEHSPDEG
jgi:hypothetical protein